LRAILDDDRQRGMELDHGRFRYRIEAEGAASPGNHAGSETAPSGPNAGRGIRTRGVGEAVGSQ
jgi:hypothetical protein